MSAGSEMDDTPGGVRESFWAAEVFNPLIYFPINSFQWLNPVYKHIVL